MKGKMFKYIFSLLLLFVALSGNSQTINGRLYTQFNNYYKWRGGAFDSVFLLPNLTGTAGLRGGALRYNGSDSSLYVYTGTQWRKIDGSGGSTVDTTSLSNRINLKLNISDTVNMLSPYLRSNVAAATFQPIGNYITTGSDASLRSLNITGTNGNGHIHLRHQASLPTATGQSTTIYANSQGNFAWKNDGGYHTTLKTDGNTGNREYTYKDLDYVLANDAEVVKYTDTAAMLDGRISSITLNTSGAIHTNPITFSRVGGAWAGTMSLTTQTANRVFAGPTTGSAATPTFRALVDADIPSTSKGVQWTGLDSVFAKLSVESGYHHAEEFDVILNSTTTSTFLNGTKYSFTAGSGNFISTQDTTGIGIRLGTLTSSTAAPYINFGPSSGNAFFLPITNNDWVLWSCRVRIPTLNDGTERFYIKAGLTTGLNITTPSSALMFAYDLNGSMINAAASANFQTVSAASNVRTWNTTSTTVTANQWYKLAILFKAGVAYYYIDNVLVQTHTTNIPAAGTSLVPYFDIRKTNGTTARNYDIDYSTIDIKYSTPR
jgi:hypothetical protein